VRVLYFAWVRELVGVDEERVSPPSEVVTVAALVDWLSGRSEGHARAFADPARLRAAVDQAFVPFDAPIAGAREVALFPPVTGG
jgi:molybdopterin synthase sulfur carrier subunit